MGLRHPCRTAGHERSYRGVREGGPLTATDNPSGRGLLIGWSVGSLASALCLLTLWVGIGEAAGPWKAQIVDAETGRPLEGVVVLAVWIRYTASVGGWAGAKYYASEEVVTGP